MIKLKLNTDEVRSLINFTQTAIGIARDEMENGKDIMVSQNSIIDIPWEKSERSKNILRIAERNTHIDEFEKLQMRLIVKLTGKKAKTVTITKVAGYYLLIYMNRSEHYIQNEYTNLVVRTQAGTILKELI